MKLAALDIGSNSIKLAVVDAAASDSFAVLSREKDTVRLGQQTLQKGRLTAEAIESAVRCIQRFKATAAARPAQALVAAAQAAGPEARNSAPFISDIVR